MEEQGAIFFFLQTRIAIPRYFSQSYGAYFKYIIHVHVHVHTRTVNVCAMLMISYVILKYAPYDWLKCNPRLQKKKIASRGVSTSLKVRLLRAAAFTIASYGCESWSLTGADQRRVDAFEIGGANRL